MPLFFSSFGSYGSRALRALALLACLVLAGCENTTEIRVRSPSLVGATAKNATGTSIELPGDGRPGEATGTLPAPVGYLFGGRMQRLTFVREPSGELRYEAPDTEGSEEGELVAPDGAITVPPSYMGAENAARYGSEARMRFLVWYEGPSGRSSRPRRVPSFDIWLSTPLSNVAQAQVRTKPIRGIGVVFAALGGALLIGGAASFLAGGENGRAAAAFLGGIGLAFGAGGTVLLAVPETTTPIDFAER